MNTVHCLDSVPEESAVPGRNADNDQLGLDERRSTNEAMIQPVSSRPRTCITRYYIQGWALGTGLRVSLPPGRYEITGEETFQGARFFRLNNKYRVAARDVQVEDTSQTSSR